METIRLLILATLSIGLLSISCKKEEEPVIKEGEFGLIYLDENGVTIKAYDIAQAGDTDILEGVTYTIVDSAMLYAMVEEGEDVTNVVTSRVSNMYCLLADDTLFNQDISNWDVSNVTDMGYMFFNAYAFNQNISNWDVSTVRNMNRMFFGIRSFNQDISSWDVSNVTIMNGMFKQASFNRDISNWDVGNVASMPEMFIGSSFNQDISNWDVSNVTNMYRMFMSNCSFNQDLSSWDVSSVVNCGQFYDGYHSWSCSPWNLPKPNFNNCGCGCN